MEKAIRGKPNYATTFFFALLSLCLDKLSPCFLIPHPTQQQQQRYVSSWFGSHFRPSILT